MQDETAKFFLLRDNVLIKPNADSEVHAAQVYVDTANDIITFVGLVQGKAKSATTCRRLRPDAAAGQAGQAGQGTPGQQSGVRRRRAWPWRRAAGQHPGPRHEQHQRGREAIGC